MKVFRNWFLLPKILSTAPIIMSSVEFDRKAISVLIQTFDKYVRKDRAREEPWGTPPENFLQADMELAFLDMTLQLLMKSPDCACIYPVCLHIIHEVFMRNTVRFLAEILTHCVHSVSSTYRISKSMYYAVPLQFHMTKFQFKLENAKEIIDQFT